MLKYIFLLIISTFSLTSNLIGYDSLESSIEHGDIEEVKRWIRAGKNVNNQAVWAPLAIAARQGYIDIVKLLLEKGANPNLSGKKSFPPLIACACALGNGYAKGRIDDFALIAQILIKAGADVNLADSSGFTALELAVMQKANPFIEILLKNNADIDSVGISVSKETRTSLIQWQNELIEEKKRSKEKEIVYETPVVSEEPPIQVPETTPWDDLPFGKHSKRLHIIQKMVKKTKCSTEKKTLTTMLLPEVTLVLDKLQYDLKLAQSTLDKSYKEGKVNLDAEQEYTNTQKHLTTLKHYIKSLAKTDRCKITEIDLPNNHWTPSIN